MFNHLFNPENKFFNFIGKVMDAMVIGVLWFICSIPLFTIGAATSAVFNFTIKQTYDEEGYVFRSFINGFRQNFRQATMAWLLLLSGAAFLLTDLYICLNCNLPLLAERLAYSVLLCMLVLLIITSLYLFPLQSVFHVPLIQLFRHALIMALGNSGTTLLLLMMSGVNGLLIYMYPLLLPVWFGLFMFFTSHLFHRVFRKYMVKSLSNVIKK